MSIGIEFILKATTGAFTRGLAAANNALKDTKKSLRDFGGGGLVKAFGITGVIQGFRMAINHAQELRDKAEKLGKPIDDATRSVAAYGDNLDKAKEGIGRLAVVSLSFFTRAGEGWGMLINRIRGVSKAQEDLAEKTLRDAERLEADRDKMKAKYAERAKTVDKDVADSERKLALSRMTDEEKRMALLKERTVLLDKMDGMDENSVAFKEAKIKANALTGEIDTVANSIGKEAQQAREKEEKERKEAARKLVEKFAPTVEELAQKDIASGVGANDPRRMARQALAEEDRARMLFDRGDFKGGLAAASKAQGLRSALENQSSATGTLTPKAAEQAFETALKGTNTKLDGLTKAVAGIIKAQ